MIILSKNKQSLQIDDFKLKCSIGENGSTFNKLEGDKKTPKGIYSIENLYYRADRLEKPFTKLKTIKIKKFYGWCDDLRSPKNYNKLIKIDKKIKHEKLYRNDYKHDYLLPVNYNTKKTILGKGSAIFIHLSKNYKPTAGCIAIQKKDFLILLKLINKKTKLKIA